MHRFLFLPRSFSLIIHIACTSTMTISTRRLKKKIAQHIEHPSKADPTLSLRILPSALPYPRPLKMLVHHIDSSLGSISKSSSSPMMSFTMHSNLSLSSQNNQQLPAHNIPRNTYSLSFFPPSESVFPSMLFVASLYCSRCSFHLHGKLMSGECYRRFPKAIMCELPSLFFDHSLSI